METLTIPLGVAQAVIARLVSLGISFKYEYAFATDHISVTPDKLPYVASLIAAIQSVR